MCFLLFLCGSISFSLLHTNPAPVGNLPLLSNHNPDEQIAPWAGHSPGGRLCLPWYCIQAQHYQLCFEIGFSNFILQIPSLLIRDVLWFRAHWLFLGWVAALWQIPDAKSPILSLCLFSASPGFSNLLSLLGSKFGQNPSLWDFIWTCLFSFHHCCNNDAPLIGKGSFESWWQVQDFSLEVTTGLQDVWRCHC